MSDRITIQNLLLRTIIGINADERTQAQDLLVNLELFTDTRKAGNSDKITDAFNYRTVCKKVIELVENSQFYLIEKLAEEIAQVCLQFDKIEHVRVKVEKPHVLRFAESVGVTIERARNEIS